MTSSTIDEAKLRRYLLGGASENEQQQLEEALLADDELIGHLAMAEDELIDQYLAGELSAGEETSFQSHFLAAKSRRENLQFGRAFRRYIEDHPEAHRGPSRTQVRWWMMPKFAFGLALAAVVASVWLAGTNEKLRTELASQREVARSVPAQIAAPTPSTVLMLSPGLMRSAGQLPVLDKRPASQAVEVKLALTADGGNFAAYRAALATVEGEEVWRQARLTRDGDSIKVVLPTALLSRGDWRIVLSGVSKQGKATDLSSYYFRVLFD